VSDATTVGLLPAPEVMPDLDQVRAHFSALNQPGEVREVRILGHVPASGYGGPATALGYVDNCEHLWPCSPNPITGWEPEWSGSPTAATSLNCSGAGRMNGEVLLDELAGLGIDLVRDGDAILADIEDGADIALHADRIREQNPELLSALQLREQIVAAAHWPRPLTALIAPDPKDNSRQLLGEGSTAVRTTVIRQGQSKWITAAFPGKTFRSVEQVVAYFVTQQRQAR
jgi:hypothetical protein